MRSFSGSLRGRAAQAERPASPLIKMRRLLKVGLGFVVGTICGGVFGAAMLAVQRILKMAVAYSVAPKTGSSLGFI